MLNRISIFGILNTENMKNIALYNWDNGSIIIVFVFGFVVIGLVTAVLLMMNNDRKKK